MSTTTDAVTTTAATTTVAVIVEDAAATTTKHRRIAASESIEDVVVYDYVGQETGLAPIRQYNLDESVHQYYLRMTERLPLNSPEKWYYYRDVNMDDCLRQTIHKFITCCYHLPHEVYHCHVKGGPMFHHFQFFVAFRRTEEDSAKITSTFFQMIQTCSLLGIQCTVFSLKNWFNITANTPCIIAAPGTYTCQSFVYIDPLRPVSHLLPTEIPNIDTQLFFAFRFSTRNIDKDIIDMLHQAATQITFHNILW